MDSEFVDPNVDRITLSGVNRWIDVKRELNAGEQRRLFTTLIKDLTAGEKPTLDPEQLGITKIMAYLIGWSFTDKSGKSIPVSRAAVDNLKTATYQDIVKAIDDHEAKADADVAARKNGQGIGSESSRISPSLSDATGDTSGLANSR